MLQLNRVKYILLVGATLLSLLFSLPNLYGEAPSIQISSKNGQMLSNAVRQKIQKQFELSHIIPTNPSVLNEKAVNADGLQLRFQDVNTQIKARDLLSTTLGEDYTVALNLTSKAPQWLQAIGAKPLKLGLDLRGGVHFLLNVDVGTVIAARQSGTLHAIRVAMRAANIRYTRVETLKSVDNNQNADATQFPAQTIRLTFQDIDNQRKAQDLLKSQFPDYLFAVSNKQPNTLVGFMRRAVITNINDYAVDQAMTILRNRVNELGVSEAIVQRQGENNISVDLPGIQDMARAKDILGKTATVRFQLVDTTHDPDAAASSGVIPPGTRLYYQDNRPLLLKNAVILKGNAITYATATFRDGQPAVNIRLGGGGESLFNQITAANIGQPLAVVYIETQAQKRKIEGKTVTIHQKRERIISVATINSALGNNFDITGLSTSEYARNLALLLRSGALVAPVDIVEELTIGPSLGKANIHKGILSLEVGSLVVVLFMALYYRLFGLVADMALLLNILFIVAILSLLGATLTLPGIAGMVLTVGMAVDANVLINERIREELRRGMSPLASIKIGYDLAFATIVDSNVTTLIVAVILFSLGSGSVKGFAITLIIGLLCSMITSVYFTRAVIDLIYARKSRVKKLSLGI